MTNPALATPDDRASFLDTALHYVSREARYHVADSLACYLHNDGYALEGNTEANDVEWFARNLWDAETQFAPGRWDTVDESTRERYRLTARTVIRVLPDFQLRIAHRLAERGCP